MMPLNRLRMVVLYPVRRNFCFSENRPLKRFVFFRFIVKAIRNDRKIVIAEKNIKAIAVGNDLLNE